MKRSASQLSAVLTALVAACSTHQFRPAAPPYGTSVHLATDEFRYVRYALQDTLLGQLALPPLSVSPLPEGVVELRMTTGHGMALGPRYPIVRIVSGPQGVRGDLIEFRCGPCRAFVPRLERRVAWDSILTKLDSLGIRTLMPSPMRTHVTDAENLIVEVREGERYRAYHFNGVDRYDESGQRAKQVLQVMAGLQQLVLPCPSKPWPPGTTRWEAISDTGFVSRAGRPECLP